MQLNYSAGDIVAIEFLPALGRDIGAVADRAIKIAKRHNLFVRFDFNGTKITVGPDDTLDDIFRSYSSS